MIHLDGVPPSHELQQRLVDEDQPIILKFSRGKDSIAAWIGMLEAGVKPDNIIPIYNMTIPGMKFELDDLKRYEDYFQTHIIPLPIHDHTLRKLKNFVFQSAERCALIESLQIKVPTRDEWDNDLRAKYATDNAWIVDGVRAADSPARRMAMMKQGPVNETQRRMSIVWDWQIAEVRDAIARKNITLGKDYDYWGRSLDGLRYEYMKPIMDNHPDDWELVKRWYPLIEAEMQRGRYDGE